jgi:quercetin dioxygenase-like cupin family protein
LVIGRPGNRELPSGVSSLPGHVTAKGGSAGAAPHFSALASRRRVATQLSERREGFRTFETKEAVSMKKFIPIVCMSILLFGMSFAQDPAKVDSAHYKVILNNTQVRILDVHHKPGEKAPMHSHPNHVVYSFTGGTVKSTLPDGKTSTVTLRAGQATWHNAETHTVENVGKNEIHALDIELKK